MKNTLRFGLLLIVCSGLAVDLFAGITWSYKTDSGVTNKKEPSHEESVTYFDQGKVRSEHWIEIGGARTLSMVSIYRMDKNLIWSINPQLNQYTERIKANAQAQTAQIKDEERMAKQAYAKMTPEQKTDMDTAFRKEGMGDVMHMHSVPFTPNDYKPTGKSWEVNHRSCHVYEVWNKAKRVSEICMTDGNQIIPGLGDASREFARYLPEFYGEDIAAGAKVKDQLNEKTLGAERFLLKEITYSHDKPMSVKLFVDAKNENIPAALFEPPIGATKIEKPSNR